MKVLEKHMSTLYELCEEHKVDKMYLFGSALHEEYSDSSDIDFMVRFKPIDLADYFENYISFKEDLKALLGREIDLVEEQTLKNPILIKSINRSKELVYG
ncbi:nucleotidyltransferase domain-containing protein [Zunongwangia sp. F260]|uniref:Nucleotidyltransferase domain-containing protein n=1 Tax=Autumnicola lenta TaxID=3075593 RepID=A0ABU3CN92_9FLAO|nr:nucleotidyltransferase domain-containing protein [Zunongwangia sp. F260]MDT0647825.1 nucleotidyltransferase domain-containing protein [Zunongwangia sp. F260]